MEVIILLIVILVTKISLIDYHELVATAAMSLPLLSKKNLKDTNVMSSQPQMFSKIFALKNFAIFTGKEL